MRVYQLQDRQGRVFAFEVPNIGRRRALAVIRGIPGASILRRPRLFSWLTEEEFCAFDVEGQEFVMWEPFGDNSRYWVGPSGASWCPQIDRVREAFATAPRFRWWRSR